MERKIHKYNHIVDIKHKMTEDICKFIYNVGLNLDCDVRTINCVCPEDDTYNYMWYYCEMINNKGSLSDNATLIKLNMDSGEVVINTEFKRKELCEYHDDFPENSPIRIKMILGEGDADNGIKCFERIQFDRQISIISFTAAALTQTALLREIRVSYISLVSAVNPDKFLFHFWNMLYALMERFEDEKSFSSILEKFNQYLLDLIQIYEFRGDFIEQLNDYLTVISEGISDVADDEKIWTAGCRVLKNKNKDRKNQSDLISFLLYDDDNRILSNKEGHQEKLITHLADLLNIYLENYQNKTHRIESGLYQNLMRNLQWFSSSKNINIGQIKGLERLNFETTTGWRANAKLICQYLNKLKTPNQIVSYGRA